MYIAIASLVCTLAMAADLLHGLRNKKFWFPCKFFTLNAASITVITVAMKLPVDLTSEMPGDTDQVAKLGSLAFMCTIMVNLMPSLASMDNKTLLANVIGFQMVLVYCANDMPHPDIVVLNLLSHCFTIAEEKTLKDISNSMNPSFLKAEKKQTSGLLELLRNLLDSMESIIHPSRGGKPQYISEYVNIRKATMTLWHDVENNRMWLKNSLSKNAFEGKTATEILKWFADKAEKFSSKFNGIMVCGEQLPKEQFVKAAAAKLLGNTTKIIERLETVELPSMEDDKMAYIDEWRLHFNQSIP
ncbi:hypothetical protein Tco_0733973 [Tanacetum coccineum]